MKFHLSAYLSGRNINIDCETIDEYQQALKLLDAEQGLTGIPDHIPPIPPIPPIPTIVASTIPTPCAPAPSANWPPEGVYKLSTCPPDSEFYATHEQSFAQGRRYFSLDAALTTLLPDLSGEELAKCDLYEHRMLALSEAAAGALRSTHALNGDMLFPQLTEVMGLYDHYSLAVRERDDTRDYVEHVKSQLQERIHVASAQRRVIQDLQERCRKCEMEITDLRAANVSFATQAIDPTEALANQIAETDGKTAFHDQKHASLSTAYNDLSTAYKEVVALAQRHGYQGSGDDTTGLIAQLSDWLDAFVKVTNESNQLKQFANEKSVEVNQWRDKFDVVTEALAALQNLSRHAHQQEVQ